jgi:hypothetical protein
MSGKAKPVWCNMNVNDAERFFLQECCLSCSEGSVELGVGLLYVLLVVGVTVMGYDIGFLPTYLRKGKDLSVWQVATNKEPLIAIKLKRRWHARGIFYPCVKWCAANPRARPS